ncbi:MAG TPA: type IV pilin protein [Steroidobacteraceae bacterium]|jgi:type IV pilus assembly protein PilE
MKKNGFTLVELMITVAVVAILAMIAIPSYTQYIKRGNRTDATKTLTLDAQALERCYSQSFTYAVATCPIVGTSPAASPQGYYTITITVTAGPPETYTLTAVPVRAPQTGDASCTAFTLDSTGAQGATPAGNTQTCWGST